VTRRQWLGRFRAWAEADRLQRHEDSLLLVLTLLIGAGVGLAVVAFIVTTERLGAWLSPAGAAPWRRLFVAVGGALVSGVLLARYFPNARGSGIPQTKTALLLDRGYIRLTTVLGKFGCSALSLASGIALGREGPTVQVGAGIASVLGRRLGLGTRRVQALLPIGTAAALAAAFNTPIAAVLFTLEEILGNLHAPVLGSIVIGSATSWAVLHLVLGDEPLFHVPAYQLVHPVELSFYAVLGLLGGLVSVAFVKLLFVLRTGFLKLPRRSLWWQPAVGGLVVGLLGWFVPEVLGVGYGYVGDALNGRMVLGTMALLLVLKLVATATCYASGNAGGIFGPSLFIGAMLGGALGSTAHALFPDVTGSPGAYALVGMGAAFAGIVRAPMTSVIMIFEITRDYSIIVPVMIANLISYFVSQRLQERPVYEALLHQDGIQLPRQRVQTTTLTVEQAMQTSPVVLDGRRSIGDCLSAIPSESIAKSSAWPVVEDGRFIGMVSSEQVRHALQHGEEARVLAQWLPAQPGPLTASRFPHVHPDQTADVVLQRMGQSGSDVLPVLSRSDIHQLLGVIALHDMPSAYRSADEDEPTDTEHRERTSPRVLLTTVVGGVLGLFLIGGLLTQQYYSGRAASAKRAYDAGQDLMRQHREPEAAERFRTALSLTHGDDARLALGLALAASNRNSEAEVYLREVLTRRPDDGQANLAMARIAAARDGRDEAAAWYRKALAGTWPAPDDPGRVNAAFEFSTYLQAHGAQREAVAVLLQVAAVSRDPDVLARAGSGLLLAQSFHQAGDLFREITTDWPSDPAGWSGLGEAALAQDDYPAAAAAFEHAARLDPADATVAARLALCNRVVALDPTARKLRLTDRMARARDLLAAALSAVDRCLGSAPPAPLPEAAHARQLLGAPVGRFRGDDVDEVIGLARSLWDQRPPGCAPAPGDEAVGRVFGRLAK
jgi:chloride channel protein, CIC family